MNRNTDDASFEAELRALRPARSSPRLDNLIAVSLADNSPAMPPAPWWQRLGFARPAAAVGWGLAFPATAVAAALFLVRTDDRKPLPSPLVPRGAVAQKAVPRDDRAVPVIETQSARAANVVYAAVDEGVEADGSQGLVRRVRYRSTDHVQWRNPHTGAEWEVSYPREDVLLVPVNAE